MKKLYIFIVFIICIICLKSFSNDPSSTSPFALDGKENDKIDSIHEMEKEFTPFSIQNINSVEDLFKIDEKLLIDDLYTSISRDIEEDILCKLSFVHSLNQYPIMMKRIAQFDRREYTSLHAYFSGSLLGAPNDKKYDNYLRNMALNDINKHYGDLNLYDNYIFILGLRKQNQFFLNCLYYIVDINEGFRGEFLQDVIEFYNLQPAEIDISDFKNINEDEMRIIKEIFSKGIPGLRDMCDKNKFIVEDRKLNGFWEKIENKWIFKKNRKNTEDIPSVSYEFVFDNKRTRAFVELRIWKGNMNWKHFLYRFDKIKGKFILTGLWFTCMG
jgi:hypothetical protein